MATPVRFPRFAIAVLFALGSGSVVFEQDHVLYRCCASAYVATDSSITTAANGGSSHQQSEISSSATAAETSNLPGLQDDERTNQHGVSEEDQCNSSPMDKMPSNFKNASWLLCSEEDHRLDAWFRTDDVNSYDGDLDDFWEEYDCRAVLQRGRPIHNQSTWIQLRRTYVDIVGEKISTIDQDEDMDMSGFVVNVQAVLIPDKGRGVVALEDIPEGTFVWDDEVNTARFPSVVEFRRYLLSIPSELACDVMIWAYVENYEFEHEQNTTSGSLRPVISVDLDEGSFMNSIDTSSPKNVDDDTYETNRLVRAGEELIVDYGEFEDMTNWAVVGFGFEIEKGDPDA